MYNELLKNQGGDRAAGAWKRIWKSNGLPRKCLALLVRRDSIVNNMLKVRKQLCAQYVVSIQDQLFMQSGTVRFLDSYGRVYSNQRNGVVSLEIRFKTGWTTT